jgi:hypothetical protein
MFVIVDREYLLQGSSLDSFHIAKEKTEAMKSEKEAWRDDDVMRIQKAWQGQK